MYYDEDSNDKRRAVENSDDMNTESAQETTQSDDYAKNATAIPTSHEYNTEAGEEKVTETYPQKSKNEKFIIASLVAGVVILGLFVVLGVALFYPKHNEIATKTVTTPHQKDTTTVLEPQKNTDGDVVIIYGDANTDSVESEDGSVALTNTTQVATTASIAPSSTNTATSEKKSTASSTQGASISTATEANVTQLTPPSVPKSVQKTTFQPTISPITKKKISQDSQQKLYWVQVFSTNNRNKAQSMKTDLQKRGVSATVVTKAINNTVYYRLRIGPYYNKSEGAKFLQWVQKIDEYKDSYITVNYI